MVTKILDENSSKLQKLFVKTVERIYTNRNVLASDIAEDKVVPHSYSEWRID